MAPGLLESACNDTRVTWRQLLLPSFDVILLWHQKIEDLLGKYSTAQEALLAKKDRLQFLNSEHGSFGDEAQQAIQQLSNLQNAYGDNLCSSCSKCCAEDAGALESKFYPLFEGDVNIENGELEIKDNANQLSKDYSSGA